LCGRRVVVFSCVPAGGEFCQPLVGWWWGGGGGGGGGWFLAHTHALASSNLVRK